MAQLENGTDGLTKGSNNSNKEESSNHLREEFLTQGKSSQTASSGDSPPSGITPELTPFWNFGKFLRNQFNDNKPVADAMTACHQALEDGNKWAKKQQDEFTDILLPLVWNPDDPSVKKYATEHTEKGDKDSLHYKAGVVAASVSKDFTDLGSMIMTPVNTVIACAQGHESPNKAASDALSVASKTVQSLGELVMHPVDHLGAITALALSVKAVPGPTQWAALGKIAVMAEETAEVSQIVKTGQTLNNMNSGLTTLATVGKHESR